MSSENDLKDIVGFLRSQRANDNSPLVKPAILDDETANPVKQAEAESEYVSLLMQRRILTESESQYLGHEIAKHLREAREK